MSRGPLIVTLLVAALATAGYFVREAGWLDGGGDQGPRGVPVRRGPLRISVLENGNLKAAKSIELVNELEGSSTILFLIPEGTRVEPGRLLCELDTTELRERFVTQQIAVQSAEAQAVKARQLLEIQKSQNQSDIAAAERKLEFAQKDKVKYVEGDWPQQEQAAKDEILLAEEELKRAEETLRWSATLEERGFLTRTELDADKLAKQRAEVKLSQSQRKLELLIEFDRPRELQRLQADIDEFVREKTRVELQASARLVDLESDLAAAESKLKLESEKLAKYSDQLAKAKILAPVAGMVVYAKEDGGRWGRGDPIAEGTQVRERQRLITIPSSDNMLVEASIHESVLEQVREGQDVIVRVDALPDRSFRGRVRYKALLPDQNQWWANPNLRVYRTDVDVLDTDVGMRPGMSCSIEVVVADIPEATYIPVQAVFLDGGKPVALVEAGREVAIRPLELGRYNSTWVEILSGLEPGQEVLLSQPSGFQLESALVEPEESAESGPPMPGAGGASRGGPPANGAGGQRGGPPSAGADGGGAGPGRPGAAGPPGAGARSVDPGAAGSAAQPGAASQQSPAGAARGAEAGLPAASPGAKAAASGSPAPGAQVLRLPAPAARGFQGPTHAGLDARGTSTSPCA